MFAIVMDSSRRQHFLQETDSERFPSSSRAIREMSCGYARLRPSPTRRPTMALIRHSVVLLLPGCTKPVLYDYATNVTPRLLVNERRCVVQRS
jgi:hypothetical protein